VQGEQHERAAKFIYDAEEDRVTHVKLGGRWVSVGNLALERSLSPAALGKFLNLALTRRLVAANNIQSAGAPEETRKPGAWQESILRLISRHTALGEDEVHSVVRALTDEDLTGERLLAALSILARRSGVPFREFAQEMADLTI